MRKNNNKKGFTIVELVIVIAVIAILAAVLIPTFSGVINSANESKALQQATALYKEAYAVAISDGEITAVTGTPTTYTETVIAGDLAFVFTSTSASIDGINDVKVWAVKTENNITVADTSKAGQIDNYYVTVTGGKVSVSTTAPAAGE